MPQRLYACRKPIICDHAADGVFCHEVESSIGVALNRLPAFDRQPLRRRHQGDLLQGVAAIWHLRRDRVVLAPARERLPSNASKMTSTPSSNISRLAFWSSSGAPKVSTSRV